MDMDLDIKSGFYKNNIIPKKLLRLLKVTKRFDKNQLIYVSKVLPSGHWELKIKKKLDENNLNILITPIKSNGIAASVLNKWIFFIEYNKNCIINNKEDNSNLNIETKNSFKKN